MDDKQEINRIRFIGASFIWYSVALGIPFLLLTLASMSVLTTAYVTISFGLLFWLSVDTASRKSADETVGASLVVVPVFWYILLLLLPVVAFFRPEALTDTTKSNYGQQPDSEEEESINALLSKMQNQSEINQSIFNDLKNRDYEDLNDFYIQTIGPSIRKSIEYSTNLKRIENKYDLSNFQYKEISPLDFSDWYGTQKVNISRHSERQEPFIEHGRELHHIFGYTPRIHYLVDLKSFAEERKKISQYLSTWEIIVTPYFKRAFKKFSDTFQLELLPCIEEIIINPKSSKSKPLGNNKKGLWRYRVNKHRILYSLEKRDQLLIFVDIASRNKVYK